MQGDNVGAMKLLKSGFSAMTVILVALLIGLPLVLEPSYSDAAPKKTTSAKKKKKKPEPPAAKPVTRPVVIKPVDPSRLSSALLSAKQIDVLVDKNHQQYQVKPNPLSTDEQFVRRIYLDITGTIPTYKQVNAFLVNHSADKRSRLIDTLLNSPGYASHHFNFWGDILRLKDRLDNNVSASAYNEWIKLKLEENLPFDQFVHEMLTAEGKYWEHPETGYLLHDIAMPLDAMSNTLRVFLGTQIGCAQCHNHPFDLWSQKEFYEMAAFTFGTQGRLNNRDFGGKNRVGELKAEMKTIDPKYNGGGAYNRFLNANLYFVRDEPKRKLKLPHTYSYGDAKPDSIVEPSAILGPDAPVAKGEAPRPAFARWLTSPENPRFALTIANRLWKLALGVGQIEPVDNIRDQSVAENPALLEFLTAEMIRVKFDTKEYLRILYNTKAYQRQACFEDRNLEEVYHYPGPLLRRMTAEQAWDSFITLAVFRPDEYRQPPAKLESRVIDIDLQTATAAKILDRIKELNEVSGSKARTAREKDHRYKGQLLVRASELPLPAPPGHFLREFGQSDRELIEAESSDGSVPQVLQMFNGPITHMLLEEGSLMYFNVMTRASNEERVRIIFLSILSRKPNPAELKVALEEIRDHEQAGFGNVIWSLVNTREFLFIQ